MKKLIYWPSLLIRHANKDGWKITFTKISHKLKIRSSHQLFRKLDRERESTSPHSNGYIPKVIVLVHDAHFHGAQVLALNIVKVMKIYFHAEIAVILKESGILLEDFMSFSSVYRADELNNKLVKEFEEKGFTTIIANSVATADLLPAFENRNFKVLSLIHELPELIFKMGFENNLKMAHQKSLWIIYPNEVVLKANLDKFQIEITRAKVLPQGLFNPPIWSKADKGDIFQRFKTRGQKVVLSIGYGDLRKGLDLVIKAAHQSKIHKKNLVFIWLGSIAPEVINSLKHEYEEVIKYNLHIYPPDRRINKFYNSADLFFLSSREDPLPSVVLEAISHGLPVVTWKYSGGAANIVSENNVGKVFDNYDEVSALKTIEETLRLRSDLSKNCLLYSSSKIASTSQYVFSLFELAGLEYEKKSALLNPDDQFEKKLNSILLQKNPAYEILIPIENDDTLSDVMCAVLDKHPLMKFKVGKI